MAIAPGAEYLPVGNHGGPMAGHDGLVIHVQDGSGSLYGWFNNPSAQASSHFWVSQNGRLEQYIDTDLESWAQMAGNARYLSVETEGTPDQPLTERQAATLEALISWCVAEYGFPRQLVDHGARGITTHAHYPSGAADPDWGGHPCPGPVRAAQLPGLVSPGPAVPARPAPAPAPAQIEEVSMLVIVSDGSAEWLCAKDRSWKHHLVDTAVGGQWAQVLGQNVVPTDAGFVNSIATTI